MSKSREEQLAELDEDGRMGRQIKDIITKGGKS